MRRGILLFAAIGVFIPAISFAQVLEKDFIRTGQGESLIDSWRISNGKTTAQQFSGLVEVIVSGFGVNVPQDGLLEDAFYRIDPAAPDVPVQGPGVLPPVGLHISFAGCSLSFECGAPRIETLLVYVDDVGFVEPPQPTVESMLQTIPYSPQHVYRFVIDVGATPQLLTLGHGDGGVFDNEGHFHIQLFSVTRSKKGGRR